MPKIVPVLWGLVGFFFLLNNQMETALLMFLLMVVCKIAGKDTKRWL